MTKLTMALYRISDRDPNYKSSYFSGSDIKDMAVYDADSKKAGRVMDLLVDDAGTIQYLVVRTGWFGFHKKVLLPVSYYAYNTAEDYVYTHSLRKPELEALPEYDEARWRSLSDGESLDDVYDRELRQLCESRPS